MTKHLLGGTSPTDPNWQFEVFGDVHVTGTFTTDSDERFKKNIKEISGAFC